MNITARSLTPEEAALISAEIRNVDGIIGYRPAELIKLRQVLVAESRKEVVGILAFVELRGIIDLKIFIIREKFRGRGYGQQLFDAALAEMRPIGKPIYTITRNPIVLRLLYGAGFRRTTLRALPAGALLHQAHMIFSPYRIREYRRKRHDGARQLPWSYWVLPPI